MLYVVITTDQTRLVQRLATSRFKEFTKNRYRGVCYLTSCGTILVGRLNGRVCANGRRPQKSYLTFAKRWSALLISQAPRLNRGSHHQRSLPNVKAVVLRHHLFSQPPQFSLSARAKLLNVIRPLQYVVRSDGEPDVETAVGTECEKIQGEWH